MDFMQPSVMNIELRSIWIWNLELKEVSNRQKTIF